MHNEPSEGEITFYELGEL